MNRNTSESPNFRFDSAETRLIAESKIDAIAAALPQVKKFCGILCGRDHEAREELVSRVMLRAVQSAQELESVEKVAKWLE